MNITDLSIAEQDAIKAVMRVRLARSLTHTDGRDIVWECLPEAGSDDASKVIAGLVEHAAHMGEDIDDAELGRVFREALLPYALAVAATRGLLREAA